MPHTPTPRSSLNQAWAWLLILIAGYAAYHNSFTAPFLFDDQPAIIDNPSIRHIWTSFTPFGPTGSGVYGRPLINFSLALNYAIGGTNIFGYHVTNLAIHLCAGLLLYGIIRRTLLLPSMRDRFEQTSTLVAGLIALLWTVHPLLTESVTSVIQRTESLVSLFYLTTLYAFIRSTESTSTQIWKALAIVACLLGMLSKEVMVTAPVVILLFDRTFIAGSFAAAWRERKRLYLALSSTWLVLGTLVIATHGNRGGTCGLGNTATSWTYALTQCEALVLYLRLCFWPAPLVFDYGTHLVTQPTEVLFRGIFVLLLVSGTAVALWKAPRIGFLGACFFLILAPSSSIVPLATQTMAEHRMYLPLAVIITLASLTLYRIGGRLVLLSGFALALLLTQLTISRNRDYVTAESLWRDTIKKWPSCARAHNNLGSVYFESGRKDEALTEYEKAIQLDPLLSNAHYNLGVALLDADCRAEARRLFEEELQINVNHAQARFQLGRLHVEAGESAQAISFLQESLRIKPDNAPAHYYLGDALAAMGRNTEARACYEHALALHPDYAAAHCSLADTLALAAETAEAVRHYEAALRIQPDYADAHNNYANLLVQLGKPQEALKHYENALQTNAHLINARCNYGVVLLQLQRPAEARVQFDAALKDDPNCAQAREALASISNTKTPTL